MKTTIFLMINFVINITAIKLYKKNRKEDVVSLVNSPISREPLSNLENSNNINKSVILNENYKSEIKLDFPSCYKYNNLFKFSYPNLNISIPYVEFDSTSCHNCTNFPLDYENFPNSKLHKEIIDFSNNSTWKNIINQNNYVEECDKKINSNSIGTVTSLKVEKLNEEKTNSKPILLIQPNEENKLPQKCIKSKSQRLDFSKINIPTISVQTSLFDHRGSGFLWINRNNPDQPNFKIVNNYINH